MAGELNFKAVFDYGDAKKSVDELYNIFERGSVKINEAFNMGRTVNANRKQLRDMLSATRQTLKELETVYKSTMEEIKQAGGLEYVSQKEREYVKNLGDGIKSTREMINGLQENLKEQNFNKNIFAGLTQGLQGLMGAYTAASGVMAQFGAESEDLQKIQTKLQASMSILMGIQQVYNTLQSTSAFRLQITAKATTLLASAEAKLAAASGVAKVALGGLVVVLAAAVGALAAFANRQNRNIENSKEFTDQVVADVSKQVLALRKLQAEWAAANGNLEKQRKILTSKEWDNLGVAVHSVNDAEKTLVSQSDAVVRAFVARAKAAALLAEAQDDIAKAVRKQLGADAAEDRANNGNFTLWERIRGGLLAGEKNIFSRLFTYTERGYKNGEYIDTEADKPREEDYANYRDYVRAVVAYNNRASAARKRNVADLATQSGNEKIRKAAEYDNEADSILSALGVNPSDDSIRSAYAKYAEVVEQQERKLARQVVDLRIETEQATINAMKEGSTKTLAQIDLDYEKEKVAIERWYDDLIDEKINRDKALWEANPEHRGVAFSYNRNNYTHTADEDTAKQEKEEAAEEARLNRIKEVFDKYQSFAEKYNETVRNFAAERVAMENAGASMEVLETLTHQENDALEELASTWANSGWDEGFAGWVRMLAHQSLVELDIMLTDLEGQLEAVMDVASPEEIAKMRAQMVLLRKAMKEHQENVTDVDKNWTELNKVLTDSAALFEQAGQAIGGSLGTAISMMGKFASSIAKISVGAKGFKDAKTFIEKFTAGVSIASAAVSVVSEVVGKIREARERTEQLNAATLAYEQTLERIKDSAALNALINAFGTDAYGQFLANTGIASEARGNIASILGSFNTGGARWGSDLSGTTLGSKDLVSDMRTGWQRFWGSSKNVFAADWAEFFDENGNLLGEELQAWYQTYGEGLSAENKTIVESILSEWERWEEAVKEISGFLGSMFNDVSGAMADRMVDNFIATGNAIADMSDYMDDFSRKLAKSIIQGQLMKKVFTETAQDEIGQLIAQGDIAGAIEYYNNLLGQANALAPSFNEFLKGINIQDAVKSQTATVGGFAVMSQDQAGELNGRFAALQIAGENILLESRGIHADTSLMAVSVEEMRNLSLISMGYLEGIEKNTRVLPEMSERMERIERYSKQMVS